MQKYGKFYAAVLAALVVAIYQARSGDQHISPTEWVSIAIAGINSIAVLIVPLYPAATWTKTAIAVVLAVLQILTRLILDGIGTDDLLLILITAAGAAGIWMAPATSSLPPAVNTAVGWGSDR